MTVQDGVSEAGNIAESQESNVNPDEVVAHQEETAPSPSPDVEVASSPSENTQEYNWKRARQEMEELQQRNRKLEELYTELSQPKGKSEEDSLKELEEEIRQIPKDDLLTVDQAEKLARYRDRKSDLRIQELEKRLNETAQSSVEEKVMRQYPDYFSVASPENLKELQSDPLFVKSLKGLTSPYDQASFIYEQLKLRGFGSQEGVEKRQLESNAAKPRSSNSLGGASPLHMANDYSGWPNKDLKTKLFKEMQEAIKGA
jgi:hypothetical protein